jgi:hypothetical protein
MEDNIHPLREVIGRKYETKCLHETVMWNHKQVLQNFAD